MGELSTSGLTLITILYGVGFLYNFLRPNSGVSLLIGFSGVLLIIGLSIRIDRQEKERKNEHKTTLASLENFKSSAHQQFTNNFNYCDNCGKALSQAFEFCPFCANPLKPQAR